MHLAGLWSGIERVGRSSILLIRAYEILVFLLAYVAGGALAGGASVYAVYHVHLDRTISIRAAYEKVLESWTRVILVLFFVTALIAFIVGLCTGTLLLAVIAPLSYTAGNNYLMIGITTVGIVIVMFLLWLYLYARYSLSVPAFVLDKTSITGALRRSAFLTRGSIGRIVSVFLLTIILSLALTAALNFLGLLLLRFGPYWRLSVAYQIWTSCSQFLSNVFAGPIATIALSLVYIDQRVRKEAFDLQIMMEAIQGSAPFSAAEAPPATG